MKVVELPKSNLLDIPGSLRELADDLEKRGAGKTLHTLVVTLDDDGTFACYGYGRAFNTFTAVGMMHTAAVRMAIGGDDEQNYVA